MADDDDDSEKSSMSSMSTAGGGKGKPAAGGGGSGMGLCLCLVCVLAVCGAGAVAAFLLLDESGGNKTANASEASSAAASVPGAAGSSDLSTASTVAAPPAGGRRGTEDDDAPRLDAYGRFATDSPPEERAGEGDAKAVKLAPIARQRQHRKALRRRFRKTSVNRVAAQAVKQSIRRQRSRAEEGDLKRARHVTRHALGVARSLLAKSAATRNRDQKGPSTASGLRPAPSHGPPSSKAAPIRGKHGRGSQRIVGVSTARSHSAAKTTEKTAPESRARTAKNTNVAKRSKKVDRAKVVRKDRQKAVTARLTNRTVPSAAFNRTGTTAGAKTGMPGVFKNTPGGSFADSNNKSSADRAVISANGSIARLPLERADSARGDRINVTDGVLGGFNEKTVPSTTFNRTGTAIRANDSMQSSDVKITPGSSADDAIKNMLSLDSAAISAKGSVVKLPPERADSAGGSEINVAGGVVGGLTNEAVPSTAFINANSHTRYNGYKLTPGSSADDAIKNTSSADSAGISAKGSAMNFHPERADSAGGSKINVAGGVFAGLTNETLPSAVLISANISTRSNGVKLKPDSSASDAGKDTSSAANASAATLPQGRGQSAESDVINAPRAILRDIANGTGPSVALQRTGAVMNPISFGRSVDARIMPGSSGGDFSKGAASAGFVKNAFLAKFPDETADDVEDGMAYQEGSVSADLLAPENEVDAISAAGLDGTVLANHRKRGEAEVDWGATDRK